MKSLFNASDVSEILQRIEKLTPTTKAQWGKMNVAQMMAHNNISLETTMGKHHIPRVGGVGRIIGSLLKKGALSEKPFGKNSPTAKSFIFPADLKFEEEKAKAIATIKKFNEGGPPACVADTHAFFGHFTPEQWAVFQWKHLNHHLRQFGV
jgi:hypothetical protein